VADNTIVLRPISKLLFDPLNPRIPLSRRSEGKEGILKYMIDNENIVDLIASIGEQGFFAGEPLLIVPSSIEPGKFEVVEGNRRLAAVYLLNDPTLAKAKISTISTLVSEALSIPNEVPTLEFDSRDKILDYLGYRHITGVDDWDSLQKARYLNQLAERHQSQGLTGVALYKHLAKIIGSRSDYVQKLLFGFKLYTKIESEEFYEIPGLNEESFSFSLLTTATSYSNIKNFLDVDEDKEFSVNDENLELLVNWMFKENSENVTRVPESRSLKTLNSIVAHDRALEMFKAGRSLEEAGLLTDEPRENFIRLLNQAYQRLLLAQDSVHHISNFEDSDIRLSEDVKNLARTIHTMVIHSKEDD
jgi:hypothetical protein